ncbi:hypothetical protein BJX61DRAFT_441254 [Aspergillus egyptiacus]|nr:hypothetical protein BJX61DRAFT_441254 [Aspergillus egyptiacus]
MSPPVRIAIQGAYLVAIFFTGVTFGGLAIVFKELAEGLGCLLGGFCTSMWLLSTKPGGLLTETGAKTGFIGAISVAFYAVSFSHYTRPYGLIAATSIAGGTAVSLGIDCYSKAGLKEFWLYLWALNDDIFPLGTNTYPVTRYIKVELAATVIIAIMGVISQLRLWRVVRERRAKEEERLQEEQKQKDEAEAEAARKLEEENLEERMEWEAKYGNPATERSASIPESTAGLQKCDVDGEHTDKNEVNEKESLSDSVVSYRCSDCRARGADGTTECSDAQSQKEEPESDSCADQIVDNSDSKALIGNARDDRSSDVTAIVGSESVSIYSKRLSILSRRSAKSYARTIAESQEALIGHDDASSTQGVVDETNEVGSDCHTIAAESHYQEMLDEEQPAQLEEKTGSDDTSEPEADTESRGVQCGPETAAARGSADPEGHQLEEKLEEEILEERALDMDRCEELPAASVEAGSPHGEVQKETPAQIQAAKSEDTQGDPSNQGEGVRNEAKQQVETVAEGTVLLQGKNALRECGEPTANDQEKESVAEEKDSASSKPGESSASSPPSGDQPAREDGQRFASTEKQEAPPNGKTRAKQRKQMDEEKKVPKRLDAETVEQIPKHTSRVIQTYRMNEWAKHLADADMPELEPIQPSEEKQPESPAEKEEAAPVKVAELLQTPLNAQLPPAVETRVSNGSRPYDRWTDSHRKKRSKSPSRLSGGSVGSEHSFQHFPPVVQPPGNIASSSSATVLPHAVSVEPARGESESKPKWKGPPPLIAVREDMMRSRQSLLSLPTDSYARHSTGSPTDFSPRYSSTFPIPEEDGDDIPLSQRRTMLHQAVPVATTLNTPAPPRWSHGGVPSRANSPAALAAWRESVREELLQERHDLLGMSHSAVLPGERRASPFGQSGQRNASSARVHIERKIAERMQQGDMSELHREAMRQMQAKANQSVSRLV